MKEKRHKKKDNPHKDDKKRAKRDRKRSISGSSSESDTEKWIEKPPSSYKRDDWMSMTGILKTFTKDDVKSKRDVQEKKHIDSYNPATSSRELNPHWKDGGSGIPLSPESYRRSRPFLKPKDNEYGFYKSSVTKESDTTQKDKEYKQQSRATGNWRCKTVKEKQLRENETPSGSQCSIESSGRPDLLNMKEDHTMSLDLTKMNKLAAKIVKAEIIGDSKLVEELKRKLEAARKLIKESPDTQNQDKDDGVILSSTSRSGSSRPLKRIMALNDSRKRKSETHNASGRVKYFSNDDKYDLAQMFEQEKYGSNYNEEAQLANVLGKSKNPNDDLEDIFLDEISKTKANCNDDEKQKQQAINQHTKLERSLDGCEFCIDSKNMLKHLIVACGSKVYMALPARRSLVKYHCIITTIQHSTCSTALDEDVWEELLNYRKMITKFFNSKNYDVVFYETATRLYRYPHMLVNCIPLPRDVGDMASIYFKKALLECEAEWSMNKKVVDLKGKSIRSGVPKGLPYFWIDFGMDPGFAHVIEDQQLFPTNFAEEIIGGMLDLDHSLWKRPQREYGDVQRKKALEFVNEWKPFEKSFKNN